MAQDVQIPCDPASPTQNKAKLSRYRSVRRAQIKQQDEAAHEESPIPPLPDASQVHQNIQRSMSRYHRAPSARKKASEPMPPIPASERPKQAVPWDPSSPPNISRANFVNAPPQYPETHQDIQLRRPRTGPSSANRSGSGPLLQQLDHHGRRRADTSAVTEGKKVLANERERYERIKAQQRAEREERDRHFEAERQQRAQEEEEIRRAEREKIAEEERIRRIKEDEREKQARERAEAKQRAREERALKKKPADITVPSRDLPSRENGDSKAPSSQGSTTSQNSSKRFAGFFRRKKEDETPRSSMATEERRPKTSQASPPPAPLPAPIWKLPTIRPGGGGVVPLNDAPVSGVISAERRVRIVCGKSEISLPVEPTTSALQLIRSAANVMSEQFNPRAAVMYELFTSQTVRRPLRMYEHVRAVMNSWQDDEQHFLQIEPSDPDSDKELYASFAPQQEPRAFSGLLYYGYKPGKWDKRWVTVKSDGHVVVAKNESGKDSMNVCQLSDFDIYTPIPEGKKRSKKTTMSIKSQQKSAMFLSQGDFIHHFYSNDKNIADKFFRAVQTWRSYYLVNKMGQGQAKTGEQHADGQKEKHKRSQSEDSHYLLGTFNDLGLDFSSFDKPAEQPAPQLPQRSDSFDDERPLGLGASVLPSAQEHSKLIHSRQLSQRKERPRIPPPSMRPIDSKAGGRDQALNALNGDPRQSFNGNRNSGDGTFNPNGLLGSQYDHRQRELQHRGKPSQEFTGSNGGLQRNVSVRSAQSQRRNSFDSATLGRRNSVQRPTTGIKPLIDLTPQYREPPQFQKRGKGFKPEQIGATGPLIECATSPEQAIQLPSTQEWRVRPTTSGTGIGRSGSTRSNNLGRSKSTRRPNGNGVAIMEGEEAFTGGLLAKTYGWGNGETGHAVSGNLARGPMVDLNEDSVFADGSLLRRIERGGVGHGMR